MALKLPDVLMEDMRANPALGVGSSSVISHSEAVCSREALVPHPGHEGQWMSLGTVELCCGPDRQDCVGRAMQTGLQPGRSSTCVCM